jgi:hypothetical protein
VEAEAAYAALRSQWLDGGATALLADVDALARRLPLPHAAAQAG